jgi:hypothetical protein
MLRGSLQVYVAGKYKYIVPCVCKSIASCVYKCIMPCNYKSIVLYKRTYIMLDFS